MALVTLLETGFPDVVGAPVIGEYAFFFELLELALVDAADMADHVREEIALRILAEQSRLHVDAREAVAIDGEARDLFVGEPRADRQAVEALAFLQQFPESPTVLRGDLHDLRQIFDDGIEVRDPVRR